MVIAGLDVAPKNIMLKDAHAIEIQKLFYIKVAPMMSGIENNDESEQMMDLVLGYFSSNRSPRDLESCTAFYPISMRSGAPKIAYCALNIG